jgi:hypothetical protein
MEEEHPVNVALTGPQGAARSKRLVEGHALATTTSDVPHRRSVGFLPHAHPAGPPTMPALNHDDHP